MRITIRLLTPDDYDTAQEIGQSAFGPSATIGDTIRIAQNSQPDGCFLASVDEVIRYRPGSMPEPGKYAGELACEPDEPSHESAIRPLREADFSALLALDRRVFGGDREAVFRALLRCFPDRAFVYPNEEEEISGFVFCQGARIGPWVARDAGVAEILLHRALQLPFTSPPATGRWSTASPASRWGSVPPLDTVEQSGVDRTGRHNPA